MRAPVPVRLLGLVATLVLAGLVSVFPASAATQWRGVQLPEAERNPTADNAFQLGEIEKLGANVVRTEARWDRLEPREPGTYDEERLAKLDDQVEGAAQRGMRTLLLVQGTPCWTTTAPGARCPGSTTSAFYPPRDAAAYGRFAAFLAERYRGKLAAIEVWNEPDHLNEFYWKGPDKPRRYAQLLRGAYPVIKRAAPDVPVLAGALVGADGRFLQALYRAGIKGSYDGLSVHFYDLVLASLRSIRQVQLRNGDRKPLWLAEFGYQSCGPRGKRGGQLCVTRETQAQALSDVFRAIRRVSWVRAAVLYMVQDNGQYAFGLLDRQGEPKPAFRALTGLLRSPPPSRAARLSLRVRGGQVVADGSVPAGDVLELVARSSRLRYRVTVRPRRDATFSVAIPRQLGTRVAVSVRHLWTGRSASART